MSEAFYRLICIMGTFDLATGHADSWDELLDSLESELRDVLGHLRTRREWVGLTDEDGIEYPYPPAKPPIYATANNTKAVRDGVEMGGYEKESGYYSEAQLDEFARAVEAKLKEKNT